MWELGDSRGDQARPEGWQIAVGYGFFGLIVLGLLAEVMVNYEPLKMAGVFILLFWIPLLAVHELSHAMAAWAVGWQVGVIVIGYGRLLHTFTLNGVHVEWRLAPVSGFVLTTPLDDQWPRLKEAFIYFAGPGSELAIFGMIWLFLGTDQLFDFTQPRWTLLVWQSLAFAALIGAILNLLPIGTVTLSGQVIPHDGLGIWLSLTRGNAYVERSDADVDDSEERDPADWWKSRVER